MSDRAITTPASTSRAGALNAVLPGQAERDKVVGGEGVAIPLDAEMTEVALLLPRGQAAALERAARRRQLTIGQLLRRLIRDYVTSDAP